MKIKDDSKLWKIVDCLAALGPLSLLTGFVLLVIVIAMGLQDFVEMAEDEIREIPSRWHKEKLRAQDEYCAENPESRSCR